MNKPSLVVLSNKEFFSSSKRRRFINSDLTLNRDRKKISSPEKSFEKDSSGELLNQPIIKEEYESTLDDTSNISSEISVKEEKPEKKKKESMIPKFHHKKKQNTNEINSNSNENIIEITIPTKNDSSPVISAESSPTIEKSKPKTKKSPKKSDFLAIEREIPVDNTTELTIVEDSIEQSDLLNTETMSISGISTFIDEETLKDTIENNLDFPKKDCFLQAEYTYLSIKEKSELSRLSRIQIHHKLTWFKNTLGSIYGRDIDDDFIYGLSREFNEETSQYSAACKFFVRFSSNNISAVPYAKSVIVGPNQSGKSHLIKQILTGLMMNKLNNGDYKSFYIVYIDILEFLKNIVDFKTFYSAYAVIISQSLLCQRPDLDLFASAINKAIVNLLDLPSSPKLPKPIDSQNHLRRPIKDLEAALSRIHKLFIDQTNHSELLTSIFLLPQTIAQSFGYLEVFYCLDHIDSSDVSLSINDQDFNLMEFFMYIITNNQYVIGLKDISNLKRISDFGLNPELFYLDNCAKSKYNSSSIIIHLPNKVLRFSPEMCHGYPGYIMLYDKIISTLMISQAQTGKEKAYNEIIAKQLATRLLDLVFTESPAKEIQTLSICEN